MHQWGSAADIYVDPKDMNRMEDLNRDGRIDVQRFEVTLRRDRGVARRTRTLQKFQGGMGFYPAQPAPIRRSSTSTCVGRAARWQG